MKPIGAVTLALLACLVSACAAGDTGRLQGESGPVTWEVTNLRYRVSAAGDEVRWYYTLVLKETAGRTIQFEKAERGSYGLNLSSIPSEVAFQRKLSPLSELRLNYRDGLLDPRRLSTMTVFRRFRGKDDTGRSITVDVRIPLSTSTARRIEASGAPGPLPPARVVQAGDFNSLAGTWRGYDRDEKGFELPLEVIIKNDGSFEAAEDEPVTNRFRGTLSIRDGQILYSTRNDTGTLTLHEGGGTRVLAGDASGRREALPDKPGASRYTVTYSIRLQAPAAETAGAAPTASASPPSQTAAKPAAPQGDSSAARLTERARTLEIEAETLLRDGRYTEGLPKAREALSLGEQALGPRHLAVAQSAATLGEYYRAQGQYADAERLFRRAFEIRRELLTSDHPLVAETLNSLAMLRNAQALYAEAEKALLQALEILDRVRATELRNNALQAEVLENLAKVYRALGKVTEAEEAQAKAHILWTSQ